MKINNQPKAQMHASGDSADTGASQGARSATEDAPVSARPSSPSIDSEVVAIAKRRRFTNADKRRIVLAAAACTKPGEIGALMRREGAYSSSLAAYFSDRGRLFQTDRGRRFNAIVDAQGCAQARS